VRGVAFTTILSPLAGAAVMLAFVSIGSAIQSVRLPGGFLDALAAFSVAAMFASVIAGPLAFVAGLVGTGLAIHWARSGIPPRPLFYRIGLSGGVLGASCGCILALGLAAPEHRWNDAISLFIPTGLLVGTLLGVTAPCILGAPYRRLAAQSGNGM